MAPAKDKAGKKGRILVQSRKPLGANSKGRRKKQVVDLSDDEGDKGDDQGATAATQMVKREAFETFTTEKQLEGGLCIVRSLGGGEYEIVNLKSVDRDLISSEEVGRSINEDRERFQAFQIDEAAWNDAKLKVGQAVKSASWISQ